MTKIVFSNSYPLNFQRWRNFRVRQKNIGKYYDKTLKHFIWAYANNLRKNSFFIDKELCPIETYMLAECISTVKNLEDKNNLSKNDLLTRKRIMLKNLHYTNVFLENFYYNKLFVRSLGKNKLQHRTNFELDVNVYRPVILKKKKKYEEEEIKRKPERTKQYTNTGVIEAKDNIRIYQLFFFYRWKLVKSPSWSWNHYPKIIKEGNKLFKKIISLKKFSFIDFIKYIRLLYLKKQFSKVIKENRGFNKVLFFWKNAFHMVDFIAKIFECRFPKKGEFTETEAKIFYAVYKGWAGLKPPRYTRNFLKKKNIHNNVYSYLIEEYRKERSRNTEYLAKYYANDRKNFFKRVFGKFNGKFPIWINTLTLAKSSTLKTLYAKYGINPKNFLFVLNFWKNICSSKFILENKDFFLRVNSYNEFKKFVKKSNEELKNQKEKKRKNNLKRRIDAEFKKPIISKRKQKKTNFFLNKNKKSNKNKRNNKNNTSLIKKLNNKNNKSNIWSINSKNSLWNENKKNNKNNKNITWNKKWKLITNDKDFKWTKENKRHIRMMQFIKNMSIENLKKK